MARTPEDVLKQMIADLIFANAVLESKLESKQEELDAQGKALDALNKKEK